MNVFTWFWLCWAVLGGVVELVALKRQEKLDTLSETVWHYLTHPFGRKDADVLAWVGRIGIIVGGLWLVGHFAFGLWIL